MLLSMSFEKLQRNGTKPYLRFRCLRTNIGVANAKIGPQGWQCANEDGMSPFFCLNKCPPSRLLGATSELKIVIKNIVNQITTTAANHQKWLICSLPQAPNLDRKEKIQERITFRIFGKCFIPENPIF